MFRIPPATIGRLPAPQNPANPLSNYVPQGISKKDGEIRMTGYVSRSEYVDIRYDGRAGSKTAGWMFRTNREFLKPAGAEAELTRLDLQPLKNALARYVRQTPNADALYKELLAKLDEAAR